MLDTRLPLYKRYALDFAYKGEPMARKDGATMVHLAIEPELQRRVSEFRFDNRIPTKSAAWKWLVRAALDAGLKPTPEDLQEMERG